MCITLHQSPSALTQVYYHCLHLHTSALTHHSLSSLSPAVVTEGGLTPPAHGDHHAKQHTHTAVPQLASGAPYTHHSQLHFHTVRTVPQEVYRDASVCSLLQPQVVAQCFDGHLRSQKKAAGGKDRDIRTCSKCTPVTAHPDWMQSAVAIVAEYVCTVRMYVLSEIHATSKLVTHICTACKHKQALAQCALTFLMSRFSCTTPSTMTLTAREENGRSQCIKIPSRCTQKEANLHVLCSAREGTPSYRYIAGLKVRSIKYS